MTLYILEVSPDSNSDDLWVDQGDFFSHAFWGRESVCKQLFNGGLGSARLIG